MQKNPPQWGGFFSLFLFYQFQYLIHSIANGAVILPPVGTKTTGAILETLFRVTETSAAVLPKAVQWTIAEQTAKSFRVSPFMAGEIFALLILKKIVMGHTHTSVQGKMRGGS